MSMHGHFVEVSTKEGTEVIPLVADHLDLSK